MGFYCLHLPAFVAHMYRLNLFPATTAAARQEGADPAAAAAEARRSST